MAQGRYVFETIMGDKSYEIDVEAEGLLICSYCKRILKNKWTEEDLVESYEDILTAMTEVLGTSRKENAYTLYKTLKSAIVISNIHF